VTSNPPSRALLVAAFAAVYIIWGTTYLAIHFAIETIPPFLMTGVRFLLAGGALFTWAKLSGAPMPTRANWRAAAISGFILFVLNNSLLVWAEGPGGLPSGIAAVLVATLPMWIVLLTWFRPGGTFPGGMVIAGLVVGFIGIVMLFNPDSASGNMIGVVAVIFASFFWAYGSLYAKNAPLPKSTTMATATQLLCGSAMQFALAIPTGELATLDLAKISGVSLLAMLYLGIASSIFAYSAFVWLMRVSTPTKVATYAYVNPVVAVFLGWLLASEELTPRTLIAAGVIIAAVVMINLSKGKSLPRLRRLRRLNAEAVKVTT
jgi:drug/metabolite transporter (DMT)-like permease